MPFFTNMSHEARFKQSKEIWQGNRAPQARLQIKSDRNNLSAVFVMNNREFSNLCSKSAEPQKNLKTSPGSYPGLEQSNISKKPNPSRETVPLSRENE